ncbi:Bromodomain containing protein [Gracilaria domingensis]|nr:Bromodomain containing protein [Gracilaria domingensis]
MRAASVASVRRTQASQQPVGRTRARSANESPTANGSHNVAFVAPSNAPPDDPRRIELLRRLNQITRQRCILEKQASLPGKHNNSALNGTSQTLPSRTTPRGDAVAEPSPSRSRRLRRSYPEQNGEEAYRRPTKVPRRATDGESIRANGRRHKSVSPKRRRREISLDGKKELLSPTLSRDGSENPSPAAVRVAEKAMNGATDARHKSRTRAVSPPRVHGKTSTTREKVLNIDLNIVDDVPSKRKLDSSRSGTQGAKTTKAKPPLSASTPGSRGSARVRTPSVLLSSHPGERGTTFPKNAASKNRQVTFCLRIVKDFLRLKDAFGFSKPIESLWSVDQLPGYFDIITKPMDLDTVRNRLESGYYLSTPGQKEVEEVVFDAKAFTEDMRLIFENARTYNRSGDFYYESATRLLEKFESRMAHMPTMEQITAQAVKKTKKRKKSASTPIDVDRPVEPKKMKSSSSSAAAVEAPRSSSSKKKSRIQGATKGKPSAKTTAKKKKPVKPEETKKESKKSLTVEEMETRLRALRRQRTVNEAGSPASPAPGGASYLAEAKALYHVPMTFDEKLQLSKNVSKLPSDKLSKIVALATKNASSSMEVNHNEEIELDIDSLDNEVLRDMEAYVNQALRKGKKSGSGGDPNMDIFQMSNSEVVAEIDSVTAQLRKSTKGKSPVLSEGNVKGIEKSFYDSDSSSDSDDSGSGSSGYESSSEESDSSGGEEADLLRRRRERNLAHQQAMQAAGTPLPSPSYNASGR